MIDHRTNQLRSFAQPNEATLRLASLKHEMPLLVAIAQEMSQPEDDLIRLFPAAQHLLGEAFDAIDRQHLVMQLEVA